MAKVIVGKDSGQDIHMRQWCNDWVMSASGKIYKVTNLTFTPDEIEKLLSSETGTMFQEFELCKNRRFKRIKP